MAGPNIQVEAPPRADREGGISDVATFRPNDRLGIADTIIFQSAGCEFPNLYEDLCYNGEDPVDKTFDGIVIDDAIGAPFALYAGIKCVEGPDPDEFERAERQLNDGEDRELEDILEAWATGATAITVAGGGVTTALARVEQQLDSAYVGRGVILMSRYDATVAATAGAIERVGGILQTKQGTPVIASGRVTAATIYGLGAIAIEVTNIETREVLDPTTNSRYALAERIYAIVVDCEFRTKTAVQA